MRSGSDNVVLFWLIYTKPKHIVNVQVNSRYVQAYTVFDQLLRENVTS